MKIKEKHARFGLAVPLAAVLLLPSTAFAATNLPQSDVHPSEKVQENALESSLPTAGGGSTAAAFRLTRIDVEQDGTRKAAGGGIGTHVHLDLEETAFCEKAFCKTARQ